MSGHSKWSQIKHKKAVTDQKKSREFAKLLKTVSIAAKEESNPDFNPTLRAAIERAKQAKVPSDKIENAIKKAGETGGLEEVVVEAYGPGGTAILIEAATDNRNRTISELKHLLDEQGGKWAEPGSVLWVFEQLESGRKARFSQKIQDSDREKLEKLIAVLKKHEDIKAVHTNSHCNP